MRAGRTDRRRTTEFEELGVPAELFPGRPKWPVRAGAENYGKIPGKKRAPAKRQHGRAVVEIRFSPVRRAARSARESPVSAHSSAGNSRDHAAARSAESSAAARTSFGTHPDHLLARADIAGRPRRRRPRWPILPYVPGFPVILSAEAVNARCEVRRVTRVRAVLDKRRGPRQFPFSRAAVRAAGRPGEELRDGADGRTRRRSPERGRAARPRAVPMGGRPGGKRTGTGAAPTQRRARAVANHRFALPPSPAPSGTPVP